MPVRRLNHHSVGAYVVPSCRDTTRTSFPANTEPPTVEFMEPVYHPLVSATAPYVLQLKERFPTWQHGSDCCLREVVKFIKTIFFQTSFETRAPLNADALYLYVHTRDPNTRVAAPPPSRAVGWWRHMVAAPHWMVTIGGAGTATTARTSNGTSARAHRRRLGRCRDGRAGAPTPRLRCRWVLRTSARVPRRGGR